MEDHANQLDIKTNDDMKKKAIIGLFKPKSNNTWEFRRSSNYNVLLFKMENSYNLSVWCLYNGLNDKILLWNQWMDRDKAYYEVAIHKGNIELGSKHSVLNDQF